MKELYKCTFRRIPLTRIDTGTMEPRNWIRFTTLPDDCILLSTTSNNQLQFFYIREPHYPFMNADERFHLSTTNIVIENCYGQILDSIVTNNCIISCGQDDTIRIFHHNYSFPNSSALLPSCELYQHFSYVTCLEMSRNQKVLISASLDGTVLFWLLEDCLPSRYVHPFCRIYLENMTIRRIQLVSHHLLVSGNTSQNSWVFYCLTLPAIVEKEIY